MTRLAEPVHRTASFDASGLYRYRLSRKWPNGSGRIAFVMLNPSTADHTHDDPTIRRCMGFARDWGFAALDVVNLFALRSTDPAGLARAADPIGPRNRAALRRVVAESDETLLAWGTSIRHAPQQTLARALNHIVDAIRDAPCSCLGLTKHNHPRHPLFVPASTTRVPCAITKNEKGAARSDRPIQITLLD